MSVEPSELMSEAWTRWQGHVINGVFPLGRFLGCSDHSGVFLTKAAERHPSEIAIKLVPADRALAQSLLPRWKRAGRLAHPHLLRLLEWGGCQLDGLPYLYTVMEYADQTLAQLLLRRALMDDEAREMLPAILDALAFLHGQDLVQGQLKPANILVVGDQLKLASDTIRRVSEGAIGSDSPTVYDPPEVRYGSSSTAGDVWSLGVSLFEALARRPPAGLREPREPVLLPADFSPLFRDIVARCLSLDPQGRPSVSALLAWARGETAPAETIQPATRPSQKVRTTEPAPRTVLPGVTPEPVPPTARSPKPRASLAVMLGAVVILALVWTGVSLFRTQRTPAPPPPPRPAQTSGGSLPQTPGVATPAAAEVQAPVSAVSTTGRGRSELAPSPAAVHEVIPDVPPSARRTIHGHIKVWVRVIIDPDGSVFAATADRAGPSRYFERLAIEAAKRWTFPPVDTSSRRVMQVRFDFSRDGTTGHVVASR